MPEEGDAKKQAALPPSLSLPNPPVLDPAGVTPPRGRRSEDTGCVGEASMILAEGGSWRPLAGLSVFPFPSFPGMK